MANTGDQLIREVEEDLQRERWLRLWRAYGKFVIGGVSAVVLVVVGYAGFTEYRSATLEQDGLVFWEAQRAAQEDDIDHAAALFGTLREEGNSGYPFLAGLQEARILAGSGDIDAALAIYDNLAEMSGVDDTLRQLADLYAAMLMVDDGDPDVVLARLAPLIEGPWRHAAMEMKGLVEIRTGETAAARETFRKLLEEPGIPDNLRRRANELLSFTGGKSS